MPVLLQKDARVFAERRLCFYRKTPVFLQKDAGVFTATRRCGSGLPFQLFQTVDLYAPYVAVDVNHNGNGDGRFGR